MTGEHAYPRPQLQREFWQSLNGEWQFSFEPRAGCAEPAAVEWARHTFGVTYPILRTTFVAPLDSGGSLVVRDGVDFNHRTLSGDLTVDQILNQRFDLSQLDERAQAYARHP